MADYYFLTVLGKRFGVAIKQFRWIYLHGNSSLKAGGIRIGKLEVVW